MPEQIQSIIANLQAFGAKRLAMLAGIAILVMTVIGVASVYLNRPAYDTLYVGLERSDVNPIGLVLGEAGIGCDVGRHFAIGVVALEPGREVGRPGYRCRCQQRRDQQPDHE